MKVESNNEDKIKVLEKALNILKLEVSLYFGICDAIMSASRLLDMPYEFTHAKFYGIDLPERKYFCSFDEQEGFTENPCFSYPCTLEGRQQRIEVLEEAIKKLKS